METLEQMLERHEGYKPTLYHDTEGVATVGIGHNLHKPLRRETILKILQDDIDDAMTECVHAFPWFSELTEARKNAVLNMCFNLGMPRLKKFKEFLAAMELGDYEKAEKEMLDSLWARQVKGRAIELAAIIRGSTEA